jgi:hypothetical protein
MARTLLVTITVKVVILFDELSFKKVTMSKIIQPGTLVKQARQQVKSIKQNARIGFLESLGDSGYDNRTDPKYCFDILRKFMKGKSSDDEAL